MLPDRRPPRRGALARRAESHAIGLTEQDRVAAQLDDEQQALDALTRRGDDVVSLVGRTAPPLLVSVLCVLAIVLAQDSDLESVVTAVAGASALLAGAYTVVVFFVWALKLLGGAPSPLASRRLRLLDEAGRWRPRTGQRWVAGRPTRMSVIERRAENHMITVSLVLFAVDEHGIWQQHTVLSEPRSFAADDELDLIDHVADLEATIGELEAAVVDADADTQVAGEERRTFLERHQGPELIG